MNDLTFPTGEFEEKIKAKKILPDDLFIWKCPECSNIHFRHAGYVEMLLPYITGQKEKKVQADSYQVKICTKCKSCYVYMDSQMYDVTHLIDVKAWEETEKLCQKTTGPGGEC